MYFDACAITNKQTFEVFCIKFTPLFSGHHCICNASKYTHVFNVRPSLAQRSFGCHRRQDSRWTLILFVIRMRRWSAQNGLLRLWTWSLLLIISTMVRFLRSTILSWHVLCKCLFFNAMSILYPIELKHNFVKKTLKKRERPMRTKVDALGKQLPYNIGCIPPNMLSQARLSWRKG